MSLRRLLVWVLGAALALGCGGADDDDDGDIYRGCAEPDDCDAPEDRTAECLDKENEGFCTWSCDADEECEEADDDYDFVCASFESEAGKHCFPSCEGEDEASYCPRGMTCRSTGGGSDNRKVCFPEG